MWLTSSEPNLKCSPQTRHVSSCRRISSSISSVYFMRSLISDCVRTRDLRVGRNAPPETAFAKGRSSALRPLPLTSCRSSNVSCGCPVPIASLSVYGYLIEYDGFRPLLLERSAMSSYQPCTTRASLDVIYDNARIAFGLKLGSNPTSN